jgi:hypothetical protein
MAEDEATPAEAQDTSQSEPAAPDTGTPAPESTEDSSTAPEQEINYEQRYEDLRSHNSRVEQENAEFRRFVEALSDPERQGQVLSAFGIDLEDDQQATLDEDSTWEDRFNRIEQSLDAQAYEKELAQVNELEEAYIGQELGRLDPKQQWDQKYEDQVVRLSYSYADEDGIPDLEAAHKALQGVVESQREGWIQTKRTDQVASGASASKEFNLDDRKERRDYMLRRMRDMSDQQG